MTAVPWIVGYASVNNYLFIYADTSLKHEVRF